MPERYRWLSREKFAPSLRPRNGDYDERHVNASADDYRFIRRIRIIFVRNEYYGGRFAEIGRQQDEKASQKDKKPERTDK